jgi:hypothetical protein
LTHIARGALVETGAYEQLKHDIQRHAAFFLQLQAVETWLGVITMRFATRHYRLIHCVVALLLMFAGLNALVWDSPFLPAFKQHLLNLAFALMAATFFLKPTAELSPLKVPLLSVVQIRVGATVLLLVSLSALANYHLFEPGLFAPYKKQISVVAFAMLGLFLLIYAPRLAELAEKNGVRDEGDA